MFPSISARVVGNMGLAQLGSALARQARGLQFRVFVATNSTLCTIPTRVTERGVVYDISVHLPGQ